MTTSSTRQTSKHTFVAIGICLGIFVLTTYLPLILQAGISVDDWGDIAHNLECSSFWHCYGTWFPLFSNRPLAPLPITLLTFSLGSWYTGYLLVNSLLYLAALAICSKVIRNIRDISSAITFFLLAAVPIIAMPVITSPINQSTATLSFLLWALSLLSLFKFLQNQRKCYWITAHLMLLTAFLTYEVILPLLALNIFLPWILATSDRPLYLKSYIQKFIFPVISVLAVVTLWQKGIAPQFMEVDSRLKFTPSLAIAKFHSFLSVFYWQLPTLLIKTLNYLSIGMMISAFIGVLTFYLGQKQRVSAINVTQSRRFLIACILCFLGSSSIFILSGESAIVGGYQARGLSSTWIGFSLFLAAIWPQRRIVCRIWNLCLGLLIGLCILCFNVERNQTIAAWQLQMKILKNAQQLIEKHAVPAGSTLMADVPHFLVNNFNDEIVFSQPWDFGAAISLTTKNQIKAGPVIDSTRRETRQLRLENNLVFAQNFSGTSLDQFWVYQYDANDSTGSLMRISNPKQFQMFIADLENIKK